MKMTRRHQLLYKAVSNIDETYIAEVCKTPKAKISFMRRLSAVAAILVLFLSAIPIINASVSAVDSFVFTEDESFVMIFHPTAHREEHIIPWGYSSYLPGQSAITVFGSRSQFIIEIDVKNYVEAEGVVHPYDLEIRYDDIVVTEDVLTNEHLWICEETQIQEHGAFEILGWFDEPTQMNICITDSVTGEVLLEKALLIELKADSDEYTVTVVEE